jgi:hypothetical protein
MRCVATRRTGYEHGNAGDGGRGEWMETHDERGESETTAPPASSSIRSTCPTVS